MTAASIEGLLRELAPRVLGTLLRRHGDLPATEDAVQEALLAAALGWPDGGVPRDPKAWLVTAATRRLYDQWRSDAARRRREQAAAERVAAPAEPVPSRDDTLDLLFLCCHPALTEQSRIALTLRAVGGLSTAQIARAFLVPEDTMTRRISRAKQRIAAEGATFGALSGGERTARLAAVLHVLYLIFNEGYTATAGTELHRAELTAEAIRLAREVHRLLPGDGEAAGLLALMLLTDARTPARTTPAGDLVPLAEQDRTRWRGAELREGLDLIARTLPHSLVGAYQVQAAIAAVHAEAARADDTDWAQIAELYRLLGQLDPGPMVTLNRAVAVAMVDGPAAGLDLLSTVDIEGGLAGHHRVAAVRAHLLELSGDHAEAGRWYAEAARRTTSAPEQRYLRARADRCQEAPNQVTDSASSVGRGGAGSRSR
ncbi:RNA polymerase ECF family sigma subunit [Prauserella shujinwangii]|uniref:RNA polymerase ECF family sigma subunit n=1 Tax=Prauserella shujinwangii TaxID=1453103 RepID=A0A2T0LW54_9PSEU|nr:DUF6596 domain-containing protein [Prauserella shujinwangii]PRX48258.1 RNA polymerase ECF family sigma subunit [Prauserella shujinwangii]